MMKRIAHVFILAVLSASLVMRFADGGLIAYVRGDCDTICTRCKNDCSRMYKAGTFKRWWCKGNCKLMQSK
ncbi:hypothetical protein X943_002728 [Babesia divergens]|uniref:Uncharacterized protein n=1 Tax=Babesia divergens TaxID=32595 RepID=A0AAD9G7F0_BABDI|nr:hypothetical protein X943_002728 [Babesia divergens]